MFTITLYNDGKQLDSRTAETEQSAAIAAVELIKFVGSLYDGDIIKITETTNAR